jgi:hypothetical protein
VTRSRQRAAFQAPKSAVGVTARFVGTSTGTWEKSCSHAAHRLPISLWGVLQCNHALRRRRKPFILALINARGHCSWLMHLKLGCKMADGACDIQPHSTATSTRAGSGSAHRLMCIVATAWASQNRGAVALAACSARRAVMEHSTRRNMTWHSNAS